MYERKELYDFFMERTSELTEDWYNKMDHNNLHGVYASNDEEVIGRLKQQNYQFHLLFCRLFLEKDEDFGELFENWLGELASDIEHLLTPIYEIIEQFFRVEDQYLELIEKFYAESEGDTANEEVNYWSREITKRLGEIVIRFVRENALQTELKLNAHKETILKLSCPVIPLMRHSALLPVIGDIDETRAKVILQHTLDECTKKKFDHLFIDLSGVATLDKIAVDELKELIGALKLIGVVCTLSGVRPKVAQAVVEHGFEFDTVHVESVLSTAIETKFTTV
ncbi:STAS domain-containing protein [Listeria kieliensis]